MKTFSFDLLGQAFDVACETDAMIEPLRGLIGEWETRPSYDHAMAPDRPTLEISMVGGQDIVRPGKETTIFEGKIVEEGPFILAQGEAGWSVTAPGEVAVRFSDNDTRARMVISPQCRQSLLGVTSSFALDHAVTQSGLCIAHAACMETPDASSRLLLHAPSGTGKTTTAIALIDMGYRLSSDDATILSAGRDGTTNANGIPRALKVHRKTGNMFDWLSRLVANGDWDSNGEQWVHRARLAEHGYLAEKTPKPVSAVIALARTDGPMLFAKEPSGAEALWRMLDDNINLGPNGLLPGNENRLNLFSNMLATTPAYRLEINGSPQQAARTIHEALCKAVG